MPLFSVGNTVYVPRSRLGMDAGSASALLQTSVLETKPGGRSIRVKLCDGTASDWISSKLAHRNVGILIVRVGDFQTEDSLLDPLADCLDQFFRIMLGQSWFRCVRLRTRQELQHVWAANHEAYSHVLLIGHGSRDGVLVGPDGLTGPAELAGLFKAAGCSSKVFLSLCCETGAASFARPFSESGVCLALIAPLRALHGAIASNLCQSYFTHHFLDGLGVKASFNRVKNGLPGGGGFRFWCRGKLGGNL